MTVIESGEQSSYLVRQWESVTLSNGSRKERTKSLTSSYSDAELQRLNCEICKAMQEQGDHFVLLSKQYIFFIFT